MPRLIEEEIHKIKRGLRASARKKGFGKKRTDTYVFGRLRKLGWKPARERN